MYVQTDSQIAKPASSPRNSVRIGKRKGMRNSLPRVSFAMQEKYSPAIYSEVPANIAFIRNFLSPLYAARDRFVSRRRKRTRGSSYLYPGTCTFVHERNRQYTNF